MSHAHIDEPLRSQLRDGVRRSERRERWRHRFAIAVFWFALLLYVAGGFLSAAYYQQHQRAPCKPDVLGVVYCESLPPFMVGVYWPVHWAWIWALEVTR